MVGLELHNAPSNARNAHLTEDNELKDPTNFNLEVGMLFETIHPLDLDTLAGARINKVLRHGYFVAQVKYRMTSIFFPLHISSSWVLPVGFAAKYNLPLVFPPNAAKDIPSWDWFVEYSGSKILPVEFPVSFESAFIFTAISIT